QGRDGAGRFAVMSKFEIHWSECLSLQCCARQETNCRDNDAECWKSNMFHVWPRLRISPSLNQLIKKFAELSFRPIKHLLALRRRLTLPPRPASLSCDSDGEIAFLLQRMPPRLDRARAHLVAMPSKLFNHPEAHQGPLCSVVENMQPDKATDKFAVIRLFRF